MTATSRATTLLARARPGTLIAVAGGLLLLFAPGRVEPYNLFLLTIFCRLVVMAQSWNLLAGHTGLLSLGNHAFMGVGGYAMAQLLVHRDWPFLGALLAGSLIASLLGTLAYLPLFRLRHGYFAIGTLLLGLVAHDFAVNWDWVGASAGLTVPPPTVPSAEDQYRLAWFLAFASTVVVAVLLRTRVGLYLRSVRDDEDSAQTAGVNPLPVKVAAVAGSAFLAGLAGCLFAVQLVTIEPNSAFNLNLTLDMVVMVIVGGVGTRLGPVFGAAGLLVLERVLADHVSLDDWVFVVVKAVLLVAVVQVAPRGVMGLRRAVEAVLRREVSRAHAAPARG